jgi:peptidyl-prolyl cis-trans isomerase A (cyclophilin A)
MATLLADLSRRVCVAALFLFLTRGAFAEPPATVVISTPLGEIVVALDGERAPRTVANFLRHVDGKFYDGGAFHRTVTLQNQRNSSVKIEVIQAGIAASRKTQEVPPIALERTSITGLTHQVGTVSMARAEPNTATSDFFICVTDQPELNFGGRRHPDGQGFAAFGHVVKGMNIVRKIQRSSADGQRLTPPIEIRSVRRVKDTAQ